MGREGLEWYSTLPKESLQKLDKLLKSSSPEIIETLLTDSSLSKFMGFFLKFHDEIRSGKHQKTSKVVDILYGSNISYPCSSKSGAE